MNFCDLSNQGKGKLLKIKSKYVIKKLFSNLQRNKFLEIIKYNKKLQDRLNINFNVYKEFSEIIIEIIPIINK